MSFHGRRVQRNLAIGFSLLYCVRVGKAHFIESIYNNVIRDRKRTSPPESMEKYKWSNMHFICICHKSGGFMLYIICYYW